MDKFKGTKGNWCAKEVISDQIPGTSYGKIFDRPQSPRKLIARVSATHKEEGLANQNLIAAAPALLEYAICSKQFSEEGYYIHEGVWRSGNKGQAKLKELRNQAVAQAMGKEVSNG